MANERQHLTEEQIRAQYANYEKMASWTLKQINKTVEKIYFAGVFCLFTAIGFTLSIIFHNFAIGAVCLLAGIAAGIAAGKLKVRKIQNTVSEAGKIERTEGYTQRFFDEQDKITDPTFQSGIISALAYTNCGMPDMALAKLDNIDSSIYSEMPSNAHMYYAALLMAYLLKGDLDHAADAYQKGFYYLNTYKSSPMYGAVVSLALGMYEYFCGRYETSLQLLDIGMRAGSAYVRPENRIPDENMMTVLCYWKAMNLASMGNKAAAWDCINYCKNFYKTDYYRQCCEKLLADMEKNHKSEMMENAETLS
ncbi:MAG: hypothetical protein NC253_13610 [Ruminococcus sp.]|nr:hypothetical protein [Ruminococcus sp.]MCM1381723.1 hypothetical protein [Muribaculaceae bacterium]MCM1480100.1 hypothetical protein [Muribaculaceae bacterium]